MLYNYTANLVGLVKAAAGSLPTNEDYTHWPEPRSSAVGSMYGAMRYKGFPHSLAENIEQHTAERMPSENNDYNNYKNYNVAVQSYADPAKAKAIFDARNPRNLGRFAKYHAAGLNKLNEENAYFALPSWRQFLTPYPGNEPTSEDVQRAIPSRADRQFADDVTQNNVNRLYTATAQLHNDMARANKAYHDSTGNVWNPAGQSPLNFK